MTYILQTDHLTKTIGGRQIIKDVSLHVKKGEIFWAPTERVKAR